MAEVEKKVVSKVLTEEKRDWIDASKTVPEDDQMVVIRMVHDNLTFYEDDEQIFPMEDVKIGVYNEENDVWTVCPPYPKYDYSLLSSNGKLNEGVTVTHWAEPEEGEIDAWRNRFELINSYKDLVLMVDPDHEQTVYRAIMYGAAYLRASEKELSAESELLWTTLCDLQTLIDKNINIDGGQIVHFNDEYEQKKDLSKMSSFIDLCDSSINICRLLSKSMDQIMSSDTSHNDEINGRVANLWCMYDMLVHEFRQRTVTPTETIDVNNLPPLFFQKLGEKFYNDLSPESRKNIAGAYIEEYVKPYINKEENN